jgi:hypothetical protein
MIHTNMGKWCPKDNWGPVERNKKANQRDKRDTEWERNHEILEIRQKGIRR